MWRKVWRKKDTIHGQDPDIQYQDFILMWVLLLLGEEKDEVLQKNLLLQRILQY